MGVLCNLNQIIQNNAVVGNCLGSVFYEYNFLILGESGLLG